MDVVFALAYNEGQYTCTNSILELNFINRHTQVSLLLRFPFARMSLQQGHLRLTGY